MFVKSNFRIKLPYHCQFNHNDIVILKEKLIDGTRVAFRKKNVNVIVPDCRRCLQAFLRRGLDLQFLTLLNLVDYALLIFLTSEAKDVCSIPLPSDVFKTEDLQRTLSEANQILSSAMDCP